MHGIACVDLPRRKAPFGSVLTLDLTAIGQERAKNLAEKAGAITHEKDSRPDRIRNNHRCQDSKRKASVEGDLRKEFRYHRRLIEIHAYARIRTAETCRARPANAQPTRAPNARGAARCRGEEVRSSRQKANKFLECGACAACPKLKSSNQRRE